MLENIRRIGQGCIRDFKLEGASVLGRWSGGRLKAPVGQGQSPGGGPGSRPPEAPEF